MARLPPPPRDSFVSVNLFIFGCTFMSARSRRFISAIFLPVAVYLLPEIAQAQKIDLNANGMSDVWEQIYGAAGLDPNADTDGDGVPNRLEALAGTDPFDPTSFPKISLGAYVSNSFLVTVSCELGKRYELQSKQPQG